MASILTGSCHVCSKETTQKCGRCSEGLDGHGNPSPTFYCSRECQATDYKQHKTTACRYANARKQLWRGAKLAQQMFFVYREATFDQIIPKVEVDGDGKLHIHVQDDYTKNWPVHPFPNDLISNTQHKQVVLSWSTWGLGIGGMNRVLEEVLKGIVKPKTVLRESNNVIKSYDQRKLVIKHCYCCDEISKREGKHVAVSVDLIDGHCYIIDLTGVEYGQNQIVMPAEEYEQEYVESKVAARDFGGWRPMFIKMVINPNDPQLDQKSRDTLHFTKVAVGASLELDACVEAWEKSEGETLSALLAGPNAVFQLKQKALLVHVYEDLTEFITQAKANEELLLARLNSWLKSEVARLHPEVDGAPGEVEGKNGSSNTADSSKSDEESDVEEWQKGKVPKAVWVRAWEELRRTTDMGCGNPHPQAVCDFIDTLKPADQYDFIKAKPEWCNQLLLKGDLSPW